jgi:hypothetical protein
LSHRRFFFGRLTFPLGKMTRFLELSIVFHLVYMFVPFYFSLITHSLTL